LVILHAHRLGNITCGVPKGSILGCLLLLTYVNDIYATVSDVKIKLQLMLILLCKTDALILTSSDNQSKLNN